MIGIVPVQLIVNNETFSVNQVGISSQNLTFLLFLLYFTSLVKQIKRFTKVENLARGFWSRQTSNWTLAKLSL